MKGYILKLSVIILVFLSVAVSFWQLPSGSKFSSKDKAKPVIGNAKTLLVAYERWKAMAKQGGADHEFVLPLRYSKALSAEFTKAHGQAKVDLIKGLVTIEVSELSDKEAFDVWLVHSSQAPGHSIKPESGDMMVRIGSLKHEGSTTRLETRLNREALKGFKLDLVVIARTGKAPREAGILFGSPSLFQRLYYSEKRGQFAELGYNDTSRAPWSSERNIISAPFSFLIPSPANAGEKEDISSLQELVAEGEELFFEETFNGNGRTCGTCHPMENNFTIDPKYIATLPANDPLFVAEFNPNLAQNFEKPQLMRQFGLILENVDGFGDLQHRFVTRGVPHTLALATSLTRDATLPAGFPAEMTGWSGDGAPGGGSLRDFATGAVTQHFTKTLNRTPGVDFRLPTNEELDALEAFQLSLGRQADPNLSTLVLNSLNAQTGQNIFVNGTGDPNHGGKCNTCHFNAGASNNNNGAAGTNRNFNTGIEDLTNNPAKLFDPTIPRDGGFGTASTSPANCTTAPSPDCGFGDGKFNTPPLVEAAATGPFFHNNSVNTIEDAVSFYNGPQFNNNPRASAAQIQLTGTQIIQVATFLRVVNALENIRSAIQYDNSALAAGGDKEPLSAAIVGLGDAIRVLGEKGLHPIAVGHLMNAKTFTQKVININGNAKGLIKQAINEEMAARQDMCQLGSDAVLCLSN
jgi:cytochrome c peroxidase